MLLKTILWIFVLRILPFVLSDCSSNGGKCSDCLHKKDTCSWSMSNRGTRYCTAKPLTASAANVNDKKDCKEYEECHKRIAGSKGETDTIAEDCSKCVKDDKCKFYFNHKVCVPRRINLDTQLVARDKGTCNNPPTTSAPTTSPPILATGNPIISSTVDAPSAKPTKPSVSPTNPSTENPSHGNPANSNSSPGTQSPNQNASQSEKNPNPPSTLKSSNSKTSTSFTLILAIALSGIFCIGMIAGVFVYKNIIKSIFDKSQESKEDSNFSIDFNENSSSSNNEKNGHLDPTSYQSSTKKEPPIGMEFYMIGNNNLPPPSAPTNDKTGRIERFSQRSTSSSRASSYLVGRSSTMPRIYDALESPIVPNCVKKNANLDAIQIQL